MARVLTIFVFTLRLALPDQVFARNLDHLYEKAQFRIDQVRFSAWIADTDSKRADGLMFIEGLPQNTGMLFVFEQEQALNFWMKNTLIPLAIGFFNSKGILLEIQEMQVAESLMSSRPPTYSSKAAATFALEMTKGWFAKNNLKPGAKLVLISNSKSSLLAAKHLKKN